MCERTIFLEAIQLADAGLRPALLDERCGGDESLRRRVEALLRAHDACADFLRTSAMLRPATPDSAAEDALDFPMPSARPGSLGRLGPYEVPEVVGRGATGVVLKATDTRLGRTVAIKVLSPPEEPAMVSWEWLS
jgi:eukaryotic-like serine/threonine-protein kinase